MFSEDELLPISGLQHMIFCERQAGLIHVERLWQENAHTVEGRHLHHVANAPGHESRGPVRIVRGLPLRSLTLGIVGIADVVEFQDWPNQICPYPIEYKKGKPKCHRADEVQLCAQAICLEEMLKCAVPFGALFYGKIRHRVAVEFDEGLRELTVQTAARFRAVIANRITPPAIWGAKCRECSLIEICKPRASERSASQYVERIRRAVLRETV
jgi:CRISPR-associated exonuclease Cas4